MDKIFWEKGYMNMHYPGGKAESFQWEGVFPFQEEDLPLHF